MREENGFYVNKCYRNGPCLFGDPLKVSRDGHWDYYDRSSRSYIYLRCRINQKYWTPSLLQIEEDEKFASGMGSATFETADLQLADQNGRWMTRSDDPECYSQMPFEEPKACSICDIVCDIRDDERYLLEDGSCPFDDPPPQLHYWKVNDADLPCQDFLHPLLLQDVDAMNRKRRRMAKSKLWGYLKQKKWRDALIDKGESILDVWGRNYQQVNFYYRSFETIILYLKSLPSERKTSMFLRYLHRNLETSPSFKALVRDEREKRLLEKIGGLVESGRKR
jgi:hypothetical protein